MFYRSSRQKQSGLGFVVQLNVLRRRRISQVVLHRLKFFSGDRALHGTLTHTLMSFGTLAHMCYHKKYCDLRISGKEVMLVGSLTFTSFKISAKSNAEW